MDSRSHQAPVHLGVLLLAALLGGCAPGLAGGGHGNGAARSDATTRTVDASADPAATQPLEITLYLMSRCPHCARAVAALVPLARDLGARARLNVDFAGAVVDGELDSMHGEDEVMGDMVEICVQEHAPYAGWLSFLECYHRQWRQIPEGWEECCAANEIPTASISSCVEGVEGAELLAASYRRTEAADVDAAPTFVIDGITVVGGRESDVLTQLACSRFEEPQPALCEHVEPLPYVPVTVVTDERCASPECDVSETVAALRGIIWGAEIREQTYQSDGGRYFYRSAGLELLPAIVIGSELEDDDEAYRGLRHLRRSGDYYVRTVGRFDPRRGAWLPRPDVEARVLNDSRCPAKTCSTGNVESALRELLPSVKLRHVDYATAEGRPIYEQLRRAASGQALALPAVVFSKNVTGEEEFYGNMRRRLESVGEEYLLRLGDWDPTAEICDNETDDDGDGHADCGDPDCSGERLCRPLKSRRIELFAMSQCPFAVQAFKAMGTVVGHFGGRRSKIDFRVSYIGGVSDSGELVAMHGQPEVDENLRQVCVQHHYSKGYAFLDYLLCRAEDFRSEEWEQCATAPLRAAVIRRCAEGAEGQRLLRESYERSRDLGVRGSPSWLLNNRHDMAARRASEIVARYCEHNQLPECAVEVPQAEVGEQPAGCD